MHCFTPNSLHTLSSPSVDVICASSLLLKGESDGLFLLVLVERVQRRLLAPPERDVRQLLAPAHNLRTDTYSI